MRTAPRLALFFIGLVIVVFITTSFTYASSTGEPVRVLTVAPISTVTPYLGIQGAGQYQADLTAWLTQQAQTKADAEAKAQAVIAWNNAHKPVIHAVTTTAAHGHNWDAVSTCESSNNWADNTGNGFYGGIQFMESTWIANGGRDFADRPDHASREAQITVAERVLIRSRWQTQWPICGRHLAD